MRSTILSSMIAVTIAVTLSPAWAQGTFTPLGADILGYAALFGFEFPPGENAAHLYRYNSHVFIAPAWEKIYCTDDERTLPFSQAREFGNSVRAIYERFGYTLIDLPCVCLEDRADFILRHLRTA